jgi:hypothetical protein
LRERLEVVLVTRENHPLVVLTRQVHIALSQFQYGMPHFRGILVFIDYGAERAIYAGERAYQQAPVPLFAPACAVGMSTSNTQISGHGLNQRIAPLNVLTDTPSEDPDGNDMGI